MALMTVISTAGGRRAGLTRVVAAGLLGAITSMAIAFPPANAAPECNQTVGNSIDSYLKRHPDLHQRLEAASQAEGDGGNVITYLNKHPDVRQHLIDLSQQCVS